jgi:hypothetical protein
MRRARIALLSALLGAVLVALPFPAQAQHHTVTAAADPFDLVARRTPKGESVYRDTNGDGVIRPDRGRGVGLSKAMTIEGADEVVLLDAQSAATATAEGQGSIASAALADCWRKYGVAAAEAYWWSPSNIKYTFRWVFGVDFLLYGCTTAVHDSRYSAQLIAKRLSDPTPAYLTNNNASWLYYESGIPNCNGGCLDGEAHRDFGTAYYADGENVYLGTMHHDPELKWFGAKSDYLRATFTLPSPDHTTRVYYGCSRLVGADGSDPGNLICI